MRHHNTTMTVPQKYYQEMMVNAQAFFTQGDDVKATRMLEEAVKLAESPLRVLSRAPVLFEGRKVLWEQRRAWAKSCLAFVRGEMGDTGKA